MVMGNEDAADCRERQARIYQLERRAIARIDYVSDALVDQQVGYGARSITPERWPSLCAKKNEPIAPGIFGYLLSKAWPKADKGAADHNTRSGN
jgi:hypothetical protein